MSDSPRAKDGQACAFSFDGSSYLYPLDQYEYLRADWMAGKAFFIGPGFYGGEMVVKLTRIEAIGYTTAETTAARDADDAALKHEAMLRGDDA